MLENEIEVFLKDKMCIDVKNLYEKISSFSSSEQCVIYNFIKCITQINSMQNNINANTLDFHEHPIVKEITNFYNNLIDNIKEVKFFEQDLSCTTPWFYELREKIAKNGKKRVLENYTFEKYLINIINKGE